MTFTPFLRHHEAVALAPAIAPFYQGWAESAYEEANLPALHEKNLPKVTFDTFDTQTVELLPASTFDPIDLSMFANTRIARLGLDQGKRPPLTVTYFDNVYVGIDDCGVSISRPGAQLDTRSTVLPCFDLDAPSIEGTFPFGIISMDRYNGDNLCHRAMDHTTRGLLCRDALEIPEQDIFFVQTRSGYANGLVQKLAPSARTLMRRKVYFFERVGFFTGAFSPLLHPAHRCHPSLVSYLSQVPITPTMPQGAGSKIYISRQDAKIRRLTNEDKLVARLEARGFKKVVLSELSLDDQLQAFRSADIAVGPHGAGLTSMIAMRPGAHVVEIFNPNRGIANFLGLAAPLGLTHSSIIGASSDAEQEAWDYHVDIEEVIEHTTRDC